MLFEITYVIGGEKKQYILEAENKNDAYKIFHSQPKGIYVSLKEKPFSISYQIQKMINNIKSYMLETGSVKLDDYIASLRQISIMLDAGLPINTCMEEAKNSVKDTITKKILESMYNDINSGMSITDSIKKFRDKVGNLSIAMIKLGEDTGQIGEAISSLADILEEVQDNRKRLKSALRYPIFIFVIMGAAFAYVILEIVPQFESVFKQGGTELPLPTIILLAIKDFLVDYGSYLLGTMIVLAIINHFLYKKNKGYKLARDKLILKVYIFGNVITYAMLGRFVYIFDKLSQTGIPISDALNTSVGIVDNAYIAKELKKITQSIEEGRGLFYGFEKTEQFESMILQMIKAGESSGALNRMLEKIAIYYRKKYLEILENISALIEPIILVLLAGFITVFAMGIFMPMWNMADAMGV